jgi:DNA polymerase III delta prime subunit
MELWVEKYRPQTLEEYVGNETIKNKIADYLKQGSIQNLLFHGVAGTGKTTLAKLIAKNLNCDLLYINASDERGIDTIRDKIIPFASSMSFNDVKIVILDEADYITPQAQATLRNTIESCSKTTRFIFTCNYLERIISPLQSRCQTFEITPPSKEIVTDLVCRVMVDENIKWETNDIIPVIDTHYPDIRKIINTIQGSVVDSQIKIDNTSLKNTQLGGLIVDALIRKAKLTEIRQILADSGAREFDDLFKYIYDKSSVLFGNKEGEAILIIAKYQYEYTFVLEKEICVAAMLNKLLDIC